jgi:branched-chain amino acid transport system permease protein
VLQYVIAGLALGGIYAIAASGLVVTYLSAGILNFSFAALAYAVARFYYYLNSQEHWSILPAALLSILVLGPAMGVILYFALFRYLRLSSTLVKVVATVGVLVAVPYLCTIIFGDQTILQAPGLAPQPVRVFDVLNVPVTMDQIIVYLCVLVIVVVGAVVLRYTDVGLQVRAMVDSPAMTSLSGTNPDGVSIGVWAVSAGLAGLTGVLSAPIIGLDRNDFTLLMVSAFAAVIAARLRNLPVAVLVGLGIGIAASLVQYALPPTSSFTTAVLPSIPFVVTAIFLVYFLVRRSGVDEAAGVGGALDHAIIPLGENQVATVAGEGASIRAFSWQPAVFAFAVICLLPFVLHGFWIGLVSQGVCYGIIFLSFTVVTGEGGMIWLCQATFAGAGGFTMAILASEHGWPVMAAVLAGGLVAMPFGVIIGLLTIRLGILYVALVTLIFGLLMENLVFSRELFQNNGIGVNVTLPQFASGDRAFVWLALAIFGIVSLIIVNLRRSTSGLALNAVRWSEPGAKTLGISVLQMKVVVAGLSAFVAGIGGAMLALSLGSALAANYSTLTGLVWLAVLVTLGIRSNIAALFAGLSSTIVPGLALVYLPKAWGNVPPVLFGLGAVAVAKNPDGTLAMQARHIKGVYDKVAGKVKRPGASTGATAPVPDRATGPRPQQGAVAPAPKADTHPMSDSGPVSPP